MRVDVLDIDKLIKVNSLQEVTNPKILTSSLSFTKDGLLSNDIFGYSTQRRQTTFAYIDLHGHYIHPLIYREVMSKSLKIVPNIIAGNVTVSIKDGKLVSDPNGWTGIENLYKHWDEIKVFGSTDRSIGNIIMPKLTRKDVFIDKLITIPPFYHDADVDARAKKVKISELTSMYSKLITAVQFKVDTVTSFDVIANTSSVKIQDLLVEINQYLLQAIAKKQGYIRRRLLSKKTDYGIRSVLTAPSFTGKDIDFDTISYDKIYIPVSLLTTAAYPFIVRFIREFFSDIHNRVTFKPPSGTMDDWQIYQPDIQFDLQFIEKTINNYQKFTDIRFDPIKIKIENVSTGEIKEVDMLETHTYYTDDTFTTVDHEKTVPVTLTDICFRAAYDSCYDRYAMATRYPVLNSYGIFFAKVDVLSTNSTVSVQAQGHNYPKYPNIIYNLPHAQMASQFINTIKFSLSRLGGLEQNGNEAA